MARLKYCCLPFAAAIALLVILSVDVTVRGQGASSGETASELLAALKAEGQIIYSRECASCHGADGQGDGAGPPLNGDMALANKELVIKRILEGEPKTGMDPFAKVLTDRQIAAAGTFVRTAWENAHGVVLEAEVKTIRDGIEKEKKK
jgi:mono/diheme cytochrome c family protein